MRNLLPTLATILIAGCATYGRDINLDAISALQPGISTITDARELLGAPQVEALGPNGIHIYTWSYSHANALGASAAKTASLAFDRDGKLLTKTTSTTK